MPRLEITKEYYSQALSIVRSIVTSINSSKTQKIHSIVEVNKDRQNHVIRNALKQEITLPKDQIIFAK